jgi:hypothetical protein
MDLMHRRVFDGSGEIGEFEVDTVGPPWCSPRPTWVYPIRVARAWLAVLLVWISAQTAGIPTSPRA